ncbi:hypothetical protein BLOT_009228, partial [Blomia tropicalis]
MINRNVTKMCQTLDESIPRRSLNRLENFFENKMRNKIRVGTRKVVKSLNHALESTGSARQISRRTVQRYLKTTDWGNILDIQLRQDVVIDSDLTSSGVMNL